MKMHSILNPPGFVAAVALALCGAGPALAQTVDWGSSRSYVPISFTSDGQVDNGGPGTQTLIWTLGWFTDGFVPTATNYENWGANYNQIPGTSTQRILPVDWYTTEYHTDDVGAAAAGKQMYIFAYNSLRACLVKPPEP